MTASAAIAVLSDASDVGHDPESSVLTRLTRIAGLLRERTGMEVSALLVGAATTDELIVEMRRVAPCFSGIYLVDTETARGWAAQAALVGSVAVVTDRETTAVALTAATLSTLSRAGTATAAGHVVIVGAARNPLVGALAVAAGIGEIDSWGVGDTQEFPLRTLTRHGTVVIDLLDSDGHSQTDAIGPPVHVVAVTEPTTPLLALPGLLTTATESRQPLGVAACLACAQDLVRRTPPGHLLPGLSDHALSDTLPRSR